MSDDITIIDTIKARLPQIMADNGAHTAMSNKIADDLCGVITADFGGGSEYIAVEQSKPERNRAVIADYNGLNRKELMRIHGISIATFYRIISG